MSHSYKQLINNNSEHVYECVCATAFFLLLNKPESDEAERRNDDECQIVLEKKVIALMCLILK
jgi:hypothetical protein